MYSVVNTASLCGIDSVLVNMEADISDGLPVFDMVGFLSTEVRESKERVRTALRNNGYLLPPKRITVNISPATIKKTGTSFDLPMAIALLCATDKISNNNLKNTIFIGELGLDGSLLSVNGVLPMVLMAAEHNIDICVVPKENYSEACLVPGMKVIGCDNLAEVISYLNEDAVPSIDIDTLPDQNDDNAVDFKYINGQKVLRHACEIAVSGMHNMLMVGPPGAGKTMIAKCIPTILPVMSQNEKLEVSKIYSVCGLYNNKGNLIEKRPFRNPSNTISSVGLVGGGNHASPGEISLAHNGVLFLDELTEFPKSTLELLRVPMEDREICISRANYKYTYPANFVLICAMNSCGCGFYPDMSKCRCTQSDIRRYLAKLSQPLLDRIDICTEAKNLTFKDLVSNDNNESSEKIRERVEQAHKIQQERFKGDSICFNSQIKVSNLEKYCHLGNEEAEFMEKMFEAKDLSARTYHKVLKVARTIADLDGCEVIKTGHLAEALLYRGLDKKYWENIL